MAERKYIVHLRKPLLTGGQEVTVPVYANSLEHAEYLATIEYGFGEGFEIVRVRPEVSHKENLET